jgi:adenosylcobinamide-GDP ribazoletransferase
VKGLVLAARFLTIVPVPGWPDAGSLPPGRAAAWFPVVGLGLGVVVVSVDRLAAAVFPALLAALLTITAWKLLTGGLHLDGLADCLDALGGRTPADRLRIMRDSRIGAFGALGLIVFLLLELAALAELAAGARWGALLAAPVVGRAMPALIARLFAPARADGHGAAFREALPGWAAPLGLAVATLAAVAALGGPGLAAVGVATLLSLAAAAFLARRLAGVTGDVLGATVELAELGVLLTVSAWVHAAR